MGDDPQSKSFIEWFRHCAPYIHAHRGRTFVVAFGGEAVADPYFHQLVHDLALLNSLGVRLVLVHGTRPQIEAQLDAAGLESEFVNGLRVTRPEQLPSVKAAVGTVRVELESLLSMGQPDSPMSGARVRVACGNFVTARPVGVRNGVDHWYTGDVRRVDAEAIRQRLDDDAVVLISNLGYSWTGEVFNLGVNDVAAEVAMALGADKLVCITADEGLLGADGGLLRELSPSAVAGVLQTSPPPSDETAGWARAAARAAGGGVRRAHLVPGGAEGGLLRELFTRDGIGTLVAVEAFEGLRTAHATDLPSILELIRPLEEAGVLVPRSRERLERELAHYSVLERDGSAIGVAALYPFDDGKMGEISCFAVHPDYRNGGQGDALLAGLEKRARDAGMQHVFVLTTATAHWFAQRGFEPASIDDLPAERRSLYSPQRASKVLRKPLGDALA